MKTPKAVGIRNNYDVLRATRAHRTGEVLTDESISQEIGVDRSTLWNWARQKVTRYDERVILALMNYFDVEVQDLFTIDYEDESDTQPVAVRPELAQPVGD